MVSVRIALAFDTRQDLAARRHRLLIEFAGRRRSESPRFPFIRVCRRRAVGYSIREGSASPVGAHETRLSERADQRAAPAIPGTLWRRGNLRLSRNCRWTVVRYTGRAQTHAGPRGASP